MNGESLAQAEQNALKALDDELRQHGHLNMIAFDLINLCLSRLPELPIKEIPLPQKISTSLLVQLSNDLRTSSLRSRSFSAKSLFPRIRSSPFKRTSLFRIAFTID